METLTRYWRGLVGWFQSLDTGGLKRIAVLTYFGVYAFLFVAHRLVNRFLAVLPGDLRPPPVLPVWEVFAYPQSVAMALFSAGVTLLVLAVVVTRNTVDRLAVSPSFPGTTGVPSPGLPSPRALLPGELGRLDALDSTGDDAVSTDGSGETQRDPEDGPAAVERPDGSPGRLDLADAESKVDDEEWPGEWVSGDDL